MQFLLGVVGDCSEAAQSRSPPFPPWGTDPTSELEHIGVLRPVSGRAPRITPGGSGGGKGNVFKTYLCSLCYANSQLPLCLCKGSSGGWRKKVCGCANLLFLSSILSLHSYMQTSLTLHKIIKCAVIMFMLKSHRRGRRGTYQLKVQACRGLRKTLHFPFQVETNVSPG